MQLEQIYHNPYSLSTTLIKKVGKIFLPGRACRSAEILADVGGVALVGFGVMHPPGRIG